MKAIKLIGFGIFFYPSLVIGQLNIPIDKESGRAVYTEVIKVDSVKSEILFSRAKLFVVDSYNSAKYVTQLNDDKLQTIVIKAYQPIRIPDWSWKGGTVSAGGFNYTFKIYCKDGRYKYELSDLEHTNMYDPSWGQGSGGAIEHEASDSGILMMSKKNWLEIRTTCIKSIENLISQLKKYMIKQSETEKIDW